MSRFQYVNRKTRKLYACVVAAIAAVRWSIMSVLYLDPANPAVTLSDIEQAVCETFAVPEIMAHTLAREIGAGSILLFDVRDHAEFDRSYIEGAIHIPPGMGADQFAAGYGPALEGKKAVFYCAAGVRSAIMLKRVEPVVTSFAPEALYNLRGGIFRWFTAGYPVAASGPTDGVHPYDEAWGALLARTPRSAS